MACLDVRLQHILTRDKGLKAPEMEVARIWEAFDPETDTVGQGSGTPCPLSLCPSIALSDVKRPLCQACAS